MTQSYELVVVYAGNTIDAGFVKSLLEGSGIEAFLRDEFMGILAPWYVTAAGAGAVKVMVARRDLDRAEPLVREFSDDQADQRE